MELALVYALARFIHTDMWHSRGQPFTDHRCVFSLVNGSRGHFGGPQCILNRIAMPITITNHVCVYDFFFKPSGYKTMNDAATDSLDFMDYEKVLSGNIIGSINVAGRAYNWRRSVKFR